MFWLKLVNHKKTPRPLAAAVFAPDDNVVRADFFDTCTHFHADHAPSSVHNTLLILLTRPREPSQDSAACVADEHRKRSVLVNLPVREHRRADLRRKMCCSVKVQDLR